MRHSVPGYNIHDKIRQVLYSGDVVIKYYHSDTDARGRYRAYQYHRVRISPLGRVSVSGCANPIEPKDLIKQVPSNPNKEYLFNQMLKEYY